MSKYEEWLQEDPIDEVFKSFSENVGYNIGNTVGYHAKELASRSKINRIIPEYTLADNNRFLPAFEENWRRFKNTFANLGVPEDWLTLIDDVVKTIQDGFNGFPVSINTRIKAGKYYEGVAQAARQTLAQSKAKKLSEISAQADADDDADKSYKADDDEGAFSLKVFLSNYLNSLEYVRYTNKPRSISLYRDFVIVQDKKVNELYYKYSTDLLTAKHFGNAPESEEAFIDVILDSMDVMKDASATLKSSYKGDTDYLRNEFSNMLDAYRTQMRQMYEQITKIYHMLP